MVRAKKAAAVYCCQSKSEVMEAIRTLGDVQRELARLETVMNDEIAAITAREKDRVDSLKVRAESLTGGIHLWCEANRAALCTDGKTVNLVTGEVSWRQRPPSVVVRASAKVIETLKKLSLSRFVRVKEEINKEAILADPNAVSGIAGITVVCGVEDFSVTPFEVEVTT